MASGSPTQSINYLSTYISSYFHVKCDMKTIDTVVTSQGLVIERWVSEILLAYACYAKVVVGLDIKFTYECTIKKCATMQLCIDTKCLVIQLYCIKEIPQSFKSFLMNPKFTFMGVDKDMSKLVSDRGLDFVKSADFLAASINKWPRRFLENDLKYLAKQIAEFDVNIPAQGLLNNWASMALDCNHVQCACITAYASYKMATIILAEK